MTRKDQALEEIKRRIDISSQKVTYSKAYCLKHFVDEPGALIDKLLSSVNAGKPAKIDLRNAEFLNEALQKVASHISWKMAAFEGIHGLITSNLVMPNNDGFYRGSIDVETVDGGTHSGLQFEEYSFRLPSRLRLKPSGILYKDQPMSDPDLFLKEMKIKGLNEDIEISLLEAVNCFRHELFTACLAMLGKASEGAWIELGRRLGQNLHGREQDKFIDLLENPTYSILRKMQEVLRKYEKRDVFDETYTKSGIKPAYLQNSFIWSNCVRESRNAVHFGVQPIMSNSYEKVAALLLGAVPSLRSIYRVINC